MSCVAFLTPGQRAALAGAGPRGDRDAVLAEHPVPPVTDATLLRIRRLAVDPAAAIRAGAASHRHAPEDVLTELVADPVEGVRCAVARNESTGAGLLRRLATDRSAQVRGWVAAHRHAPDDLLTALADDPDPTVRAVVTWNRGWLRDD